MANILEPIKKIHKFYKVCFRTYYIASHLKQPRGLHVSCGLGSFGLGPDEVGQKGLKLLYL